MIYVYMHAYVYSSMWYQNWVIIEEGILQQEEGGDDNNEDII